MNAQPTLAQITWVNYWQLDRLRADGYDVQFEHSDWHEFRCTAKRNDCVFEATSTSRQKALRLVYEQIQKGQSNEQAI